MDDALYAAITHSMVHGLPRGDLLARTRLLDVSDATKRRLPMTAARNVVVCRTTHSALTRRRIAANSANANSGLDF